MSEMITFDHLANQIEQVHNATSAYAKGAVNQLLTARNWAIGYYIVEYEQNGEERAAYGTQLLKELAKKLNIKGLEHNQLNLCRMFYSRYPQIFSTVSRKLRGIGAMEGLSEISASFVEDNKRDGHCETVSHKFETPPELEEFLIAEIKEMGI